MLPHALVLDNTSTVLIPNSEAAELINAQFARHLDMDLRGAFKALNPNFALAHLWAPQQRERSAPACRLLVDRVFGDYILPNRRQALTDINSDAVQQELRNASNASKGAQAILNQANFAAFTSALELDQLTFRATDARARAAEETRNHKEAGLLEAVHQQAWTAAEDFAHARFPVLYGTIDTLAADLPSQMAAWVTKTTTGNQGVAKIMWVNFSVLDVLSAGKLGWVADYVTAELHAAPATSVAIIIQVNRSCDELRKDTQVEEAGSLAAETSGAKSESDSDSGADESARPTPWDGKSQGPGNARPSRAKAMRQHRQRIEDVFSEDGRGLTAHNASIVFDPTTVWGARAGSHQILVVLPRSVPPSLT